MVWECSNSIYTVRPFLNLELHTETKNVQDMECIPLVICPPSQLVAEPETSSGTAVGCSPTGLLSISVREAMSRSLFLVDGDISVDVRAGW